MPEFARLYGYTPKEFRALRFGDYLTLKAYKDAVLKGTPDGP